MKLRSDHYFCIGYEHVISGHPCQDHALSTYDEASAYAVVSDGCSSGKETDMGARLITFSTLQALNNAKSIKGVEVIQKKTKEMRLSSMKLLGLNREDMLATRIFAYANQDGAFIHLEGDGVIAVKKNDGSIMLYRYDWAENTPCYPAYDEDEYATFIDNQSALEERGLTESIHLFAEVTGFESIKDVAYSIEDAIRGVSMLISKEDMSSIAAIAILSDGVTRVDGADWREVVKAILSFKTTSGQFVKRRLIRMNKEWNKAGITPLDDISCAVICIDHEGEDDDNPQK